MSEYSIELDCVPFMSPRQNELILIVLKDTELTLDDFEEPYKSFGEWIWKLKTNNKQKYINHLNIIKQHITELYSKGLIRYGSW